MTELFTASYRAFRPEMGQPVVTSLGLPRWRPEAESWPRCWLIAPTWAMFHEPDEEKWRAAYVERLERKGAAKVSRVLHQIAREHEAERLVLLCHELDWSRCHRGLWASWWLETTGEVITEIRGEPS